MLKSSEQRQKKQAERVAKRAAEQRVAGLCVSCKKKLAEDDKGSLCATCRERNKRSSAKLRKKRQDKGLCRCGGPVTPGHKMCEQCQASGRRHGAKLRDEVLRRYGGPSPVCACCGKTQKEFLEVDHVNNDGAKHRREIGRKNIYSWLKKHGFPQDGFQILCGNCNRAKGRYGCCPHQTDSYGQMNSGMITPEQFVNQLTSDEARARLTAIAGEVKALQPGETHALLDAEASALQERLQATDAQLSSRNQNGEA